MASAKQVFERRQRRNRTAIKRVNAAGRPRLSVYRSSNHIYAQLIDDTKGVTIAAASTLELKEKIKNGGNKEAARLVGKLIAEKASKANIKQVVFDRGGYLYHGRVQELAEGAREQGLVF